MEKFAVRIQDGKAYVYSPYNADFVSRVKLLGGRWNATERCWAVAERAVDDVRAAMRDIYGQDDQPVGETVDVILKVEKRQYEVCTAVTLLGRTIARAYGRDTGAKPGDGVLFLEGSPESGGSRNNWETIIPEGCVIKCLSVPKALAEKAELPTGITMEIASENADRAALEAEKARLLARLAEIEELLK